MISLKDSRTTLLVMGIVFCSTFALPLFGQVPETSYNDQEFAEVIINIAGYEYRYQSRPELGYVVVVQNDSDAIASVYRDVSLSTQAEIKSVGDRDRQGLWIVESQQSADQNKAVINTLSVQKQVRYVAPLFTCNGENEAIIPEIVVRVTAGTGQEELEQICQMLNLCVKRRMMFTEQEYLIEVLGENAEAVFTALTELNQIDSVEWAAPNVFTQRRRREAPVSQNDSQGGVYLFNAPETPHTTGFMPNDAFFPSMWHLHNTGQFGGTPDADINAPETWEITAGDPNIVVAVIDTGVESTHSDLINNLVPGYDPYQNDDLPEPAGSDPYEAHGTACAGLIAAEGNNGIGVVGVAWKCKVMPIRDGTASFVSIGDGAEGYRWAAANGAGILSYSSGFNNPTPILYSAILDNTKTGGIGRNGKGCIVFAASGNQGSAIQYPAAYPEVISVGATDCNDQRWNYSNHGPELDIVAPSGQRGAFLTADPDRWSNEASMILTTDIAGQSGLSSDSAYKYGNEFDYAFFGGTSGACPVAAGVAALVLSIEPELTNEEVRHFLTRSARDLGGPGRDDYYGWGRVDARDALDMVLAKRADLNNDWKVDEQDLAILDIAIDTNDLSADIAPPAKRDDIVDEQDLKLLMQYLGTEIPEMGLIAYWKLDETEGDIAYDSAGTNGGTVYGDPAWQPDSGMIDGALQFDGVDDYISTNPALNPADGSFSIFTWIKGGTPGQVIISQTDGANWLLADPSGGQLMTELKGSGRGAAALLSKTTVTDGNWHRVGFVWDGSDRTLYVDDVEVARDTQSDIGSSEGGLYFGAGCTLAPATFLSGLIDDIRIYNRAICPNNSVD
ncbi:MAG: S8 family serine peptidase [Sedimentisphaerales bacterium]